jgi:nitrate reductase / nitrite oxidoreductase, beta subunit
MRNQVHNWQLGRNMSYPYQESHPNTQFAAVFNINRCIGCHTCTMACKSTWTHSKGQELSWWNNVETKPYGGYPHGWDVKLLEMLKSKDPDGQIWNATQAAINSESPYGVFEGKTIFEAAYQDKDQDHPARALGYMPKTDEWKSPNIHEEVSTGPVSGPNDRPATAQLPVHGNWFFYLARICNHCTYPACLAACPREAIYKRSEDGIVLVDQDRCRGYRKCVEACPYKKVMFNPEEGKSEKCIACYPRIEGRDTDLSPDGDPIETRCMSACVGKIRLQSLVGIDDNGLWIDDPSNPLYFLVRERMVALPIYPQFGTEPNVYYIPPRWVNRSYLEQMFGPGVEHAIEQYSCPDRELLAVMQLFRAQRKIIFKFEIEKGPKVGESEVTMPSGESRTQEIFNDTVIGYSKSGHEVVRVQIQEPTFERDSCHVNSI